MKNTLILLVLFFSAFQGQAQWPILFNSGTYPGSPIWTGDTSQFQLSSGLLQLKSSAAFSPADISTSLPVSMSDTLVWHLSLRLGFSPSTSNQFRWYLWQSLPKPNDSIGESFYLQVGETGSLDAPELFHQQGQLHTMIGRGRSGGWSRSDNRIRLRLSAFPDGSWLFQSDTLGGEQWTDTLWQSMATQLPSGNGYTGLWCRFTSSNAQRFWFDDLHFGPWPVQPPAPEGKKPTFQSLIFNEIMADPSPSVHFQESEWIELKNRTSDTLSLKGIKLADTKDTVVFPEKLLLPNALLVISTTSILPGTLIFPRWPSLNNEGDTLVLLDDSNKVVDRLIYRKSQYSSSWKSEGGWSLERIDPDRLCRQHLNWAESQSLLGSSPGEVNSRNGALPDSGKVAALSAFPDQMDAIRIVFSDAPEEANPSFELTPYQGKLTWEGTFSNRPHEGRLRLSQELHYGQIYRLKLKSLGLCGLASDTVSLKLALPEAPDSAGIKITEVYFKPESGAQEYIEITNTGDKVVDLSWLMVTKGDVLAIADVGARICEQGNLFFPGERLILTADDQNPPIPGCGGRILTMANFPSLTDEGAYLGIARWTGPWIDQIKYDPSWKHPALSDIRGYALERLNHAQSGLDRSNWLSASDQVRKTPGCPNSQTGYTFPSGQFHLSSHYFTPGTNGHLDFLEIRYQPSSAGFQCKLQILDLEGRVVYQWPERISGEQEVWRWEGQQQGGSILPTGWFIVLLEAWHPNGATTAERAAVALIPD